MVGPGASVGEGIESRRPLFCSGITTLHSLFIYLFFLSFIFTFASILVCVNNNSKRLRACPYWNESHHVVNSDSGRSQNQSVGSGMLSMRLKKVYMSSV